MTHLYEMSQILVKLIFTINAFGERKNANPTILKITDIRLIFLRWVSYINVTYVFLETGLLLLGYRFL